MSQMCLRVLWRPAGYASCGCADRTWKVSGALRPSLSRSGFSTRFGKLVYMRRTEKTATNIRVLLDAFVGEERGKAHLICAVGGDTEIGALAAAFANGDPFSVIDPVGKEVVISLGERPLCFRGSIMIASRKRPLRHRWAFVGVLFAVITS